MFFDHEPLSRDALNTLSVLALAHTGDAVFELLVRAWLIAGGRATNSGLHKATVRYVSAPSQAEAADFLQERLTEDERAVYRRGRNAHVRSVPKNATHEQYAKATGLETLFGYLYLSGQEERCKALFRILTEEHYAL